MMTRLRVALLSCLLIGTTSARDSATDAKAAKAYRALHEAFDESIDTFRKAFESAKTPEEKKKAVETLQPRAEDFTPKFMDLARLFPESPTAVDCLTWVVTHPVGSASPRAALRDKALSLLAADYIKDKRVGSLCTQLVHRVDDPSEEFLRQVYSKGPTVGIKARACASLAQNLKFRARLVRALKDDADAVKDYERTLGKAVVARLQKSDSKTLLDESEKLFTIVGDKYGEMLHPLHGNMKDLARRHLLTIRNPVTIDKAAPTITGMDVDGKKMTHRDFAGKVLLLDFCASYFAPCRQMLDYERKLVDRLDGKPFALVGVSGDGDKAAFRKFMKTEKITWRMWYDGGGTGGPIATRWEVDTWPTLVLIDHKGVVRSIYEGWPEPKVLDAEIDKLIALARKDK